MVKEEERIKAKWLRTRLAFLKIKGSRDSQNGGVKQGNAGNTGLAFMMNFCYKS